MLCLRARKAEWECPSELGDPAAAHHDISVIEDGCLARRDGSLRLVEGGQHLVVSDLLNRGRRRLMTMTDFYGDSHGCAQISRGNEVHALCVQAPGEQLLAASDYYLASVALDLDYIKRRSGGYTQSPALAHCEVVDAMVLPDNFPARGDQLASRVWQRLTLLLKVGIEKTLVVAARDKTNLLRIRLLREGQAELARQFTNLRLGHLTTREQRAAQLVLGQAEQKIGLILGKISGTPQQPAATPLVELDACVMTGREHVGANLPGNNQ